MLIFDAEYHLRHLKRKGCLVMIVYTNLCGSNHNKNGLEKRIRQRLPNKAEYLHSLEDMDQRLRASVYNIDILVIHIGETSPIAELLEYQNDLKELNIILVFHESTSNDQIAQLLKLYPRYMTFDAADETILSLLEQRVSQ